MAVSTIPYPLSAASSGTVAIQWPREGRTQRPGQTLTILLQRSGGEEGLSPISITCEGATIAPSPGVGQHWRVWESDAGGSRTARLDGQASGAVCPVLVVPDPDERSVRMQVRWGAAAGEHTATLEPGFRHSVRETLESIIYAFFIAILLRTFLFQAFYIPSESMVPTLEVRDRLVANKFVYNFSEPKRQEIVIFRIYSHKRTGQQRLDRPPDAVAHRWEVKDYIKRVIAVPGDYIALRDGQVLINNEPLAEPYITDTARLSTQDFGPVHIPPGTFFVMGDNRGNSKDSRFIGPIPKENIVGKALLIFWPLESAGWLR